jgi:hypothetical protein
VVAVVVMLMINCATGRRQCTSMASKITSRMSIVLPMRMQTQQGLNRVFDQHLGQILHNIFNVCTLPPILQMWAFIMLSIGSWRCVGSFPIHFAAHNQATSTINHVIQRETLQRRTGGGVSCRSISRGSFLQRLVLNMRVPTMHRHQYHGPSQPSLCW